MSSSAPRLLELVDRLLREPSPAAAEAELAAALESLAGDERALAERLVALAHAQRSFRHNLVQTAKLAEVGLAFAEVVHELRGPLSSISGYAQLLTPDSAKAELSTGLREIQQGCGRMEAMLERMRRFLKPDDEPAPGERTVAVEAALREAVALVPKMPPGVQLDVRIAPDLGQAVGEAQPLTQVVVNLLANARDAQAAKGPGTVGLRAERTACGGVRILVADEGVGVAPDFARRLFEPFATTKGEAGTGLGLYICRELLAAWGAEIRLLSPAPRPYATAFEVLLQPVERRPPAAPDALGHLRAELAQRLSSVAVSRRVLVVEDDPGVRRVLKVLLSADPSLELSEAKDGLEALRLLGRAPAQVLVADRGLPGMSGLELARRARLEAGLAELVVVTGYPSPASVVEALESGARGYLLKPIEDAAALRGRVGAALERDRWRQLTRALGADLRPWAERALQSAGTGAAPALVDALQRLAQRPEGPARVGVVAERALVGPLAMAGLRAEGPLDAARALTAVAAGELEALVIGEGISTGEARALVAQLREAPWAPAIVWALEPGNFFEALELLEAGVAAVVARPVEGAALGRTVAHAVEERRRELRPRALGRVAEAFGLERSLPALSTG